MFAPADLGKAAASVQGLCRQIGGAYLQRNRVGDAASEIVYKIVKQRPADSLPPRGIGDGNVGDLSFSRYGIRPYVSERFSVIFVASTLEIGAPSGKQITAFIPFFCAASATPCAWLPAEQAITPFAFSSAESRVIL